MSDYKQTLEKAFNLIDKDKNGSLDRKEILEVLKMSGFDYQEALKLSAEIDKSNDGKIQLKEFLDYFVNNSKFQINIKKKT